MFGLSLRTAELIPGVNLGPVLQQRLGHVDLPAAGGLHQWGRSWDRLRRVSLVRRPLLHPHHVTLSCSCVSAREAAASMLVVVAGGRGQGARPSQKHLGLLRPFGIHRAHINRQVLEQAVQPGHRLRPRPPGRTVQRRPPIWPCMVPSSRCEQAQNKGTGHMQMTRGYLGQGRHSQCKQTGESGHMDDGSRGAQACRASWSMGRVNGPCSAGSGSGRQAERAPSGRADRPKAVTSAPPSTRASIVAGWFENAAA